MGMKVPSPDGPRRLIYFALFIFLSVGLSCNPYSSNPSGTSTSQNFANAKNKDSAANIAAVPLTGNLNILKLARTDYDILKADAPETPGGGNRPVTKFVFQFFFDNAKPYYPTLLVYVGRKGNQFIRNRTDTLEATKQPGRTLPDVKILGDQEIEIIKIDNHLRRLIGNTTDYDSLVFTPRIAATGHVYYRLSVQVQNGIKKLDNEDLDTNPSPPKDADAGFEGTVAGGGNTPGKGNKN